MDARVWLDEFKNQVESNNLDWVIKRSELCRDWNMTRESGFSYWIGEAIRKNPEYSTNLHLYMTYNVNENGWCNDVDEDTSIRDLLIRIKRDVDEMEAIPRAETDVTRWLRE